MDEEKYAIIKKYAIMFITVVITIVTLFMNVKVFKGPMLNEVTPFMLVLMFFSMFTFVLVMSLLLAKKKGEQITFIANPDIEKENDENYDELRTKIVELEKNIKKITDADIEYIKAESAKDAVISRVKRSSVSLRKKINATLENFERPMQLSLICAIAFAIAGLIPLCYLIFKGNGENVQSSISVVMMSRWPFLGLTFVFEFVAGVFLRIYYRLVDEIKYYINESVRINEKAVGLETLVRLNRMDGADTLIQKIVSTEMKPFTSSISSKKSNQCNDMLDLNALRSLIESFSKNK